MNMIMIHEHGHSATCFSQGGGGHGTIMSLITPHSNLHVSKGITLNDS